MSHLAGVTGGRDHQMTPREQDLLVEGFSRHRSRVLLHGGCRGVDQEAARIARDCGMFVVELAAPWDFNVGTQGVGMRATLGPVAGPLRNWILCRALRADGGVLFALPGGRGTADCTRQARSMGVEVVEIREEGR